MEGLSIIYNDIDSGYNGEILYKEIGRYRSTIKIVNDYRRLNIKHLFVIEVLVDCRIDFDRSFTTQEVINAVETVYNHINEHHETTEDQTIFLTYDDSDVSNIKWICK